MINNISKLDPRTLVTYLLISLLTACGGGGDASGGSTAALPTSTITGIVSKGLVSGANIQAFNLNANGSLGRSLGTSTTNSHGRYNLTLDSSYTAGPVKVTATHRSGATMKCDLKNGCGGSIVFGGLYPLRDGFTLTSLVGDINDEDTVNVTAVTTFATGIIEKTLTALNAAGGGNASTAELIATKSTEIARLLDITVENGKLTRVPVIDITDPNTLENASKNELIYASVGPAIVEATQADNNTDSIEEALARFISENSGGSITADSPEENDTDLKDIFDALSLVLEQVEETASSNGVTISNIDDANESIEKQTNDAIALGDQGRSGEVDIFWAVSGTITGLTSPEEITISLSSSHTTTVTGSSFSLAESVIDNGSYTVSVSSPEGFGCSVANESGTASSNVTDIEITCSQDEPTGPTTGPIEPAVTRSYPIFSPATGEFPMPNDLLIQRDNTSPSQIKSSDGSYAIPGSDYSGATPPVIALENLSGASLTAPIDIELSVGIELATGTSLGVDASTVNGTSFLNLGGIIVPNPNQTVFLIELEYASNNPISALSFGEIPTVTDGITAAAAESGDPAAGAALLAMANNPKYDAQVITRTKSDGTDAFYIRVNPLTPLNPDKRYIVAVTDGVKDTQGTPLTRHPGAAGYEALSDTSKALANPTLAPLQNLINNLWEQVTEGYLTGLTNQARANSAVKDALGIAGDLDPLTEENIIFSISFTTSNDTKVIDYIMEPSTWLSDRLELILKTRAAQSAVASGASNYTSIKTVVDGAFSTWEASTLAPTNANLTTFLSDYCPTETYPAGAAQFACAGNALNELLQAPTASGGLGLTLPTPTADTSVPYTNQRDLRTVSAVITDAIAPIDTVHIAEGSLSIPYYLGVPNTRGVSDGSEIALVNEWWKADGTLATSISSALSFESLGVSLPQATPPEGSGKLQSTVVNTIFPFPQQHSTEEIPVLAIYPASDVNKPANGYKTVIYQHGHTADRSTALAFGSALVANSGGTIAVLAIDQPLHGIDAISHNEKLEMAESLLIAGGAAGTISTIGPGWHPYVVDGTLAYEFVSVSLFLLAEKIDDLDNITTSEAAYIEAALEGTLTTFLIEELLIEVLGYSDQAIIDTAIDDAVHGERGSFSENVVTYYLHDNAIVNMLGGIDSTEQAIIDTVVARISGDPALAVIQAAIPALNKLEQNIPWSLYFETVGPVLELMQETVAKGASTIPGLALGNVNERHFGFGSVNLTPKPIDFAEGTVGTSSDNTGSGALSLNLANFLTTRDNFRQHILDLMTLRLSIPTMDVDSDNNPDLDGDNVHFIAHSLGNTSGIPFVEIANQTATTADDIISANFQMPGGNITRLLENSPALAPNILFPLSSIADLERGDTDLEIYLNVFQASLDSVDPVNFIGGLSSTRSTTKALLTEVVGDVTVPNSAVPAVDIINPLTSLSFGEGTKAPLAGTEPLSTLAGATAINETSALGINVIRFADDSGASHNTAVLPSTSAEAEAFAEMIEQAVSIITTDGAAVLIGDPGLLVSP